MVRKLFRGTIPCLLSVLLCGCASAYRDGVRLIEEQKYEEAIARLQAEAAEAPDDQDVQEALTRARTGGAASRVEQARVRRQETDLGEAEAHLKQALEWVPGHAEAALLLTAVQDEIKAVAALLSEAREAARSRQWERAAEKLSEARKRYRSLPGAEGERISYLQLASAEAMTREDRPVLAYLHFALALGCCPDSVPARQGLEALRAEVRGRTAYRLGLAPFEGAKPELRDLASRLEQAAGRHLKRIKPGDVEFLEPEETGRILSGQQVEAAAFLEGAARPSPGQVKGMDGLALLKLEAVDFVRDQTQETGKSTYQEGTKLVDNPAYAEAQNQIAAAESALSAAQTTLILAQANNGMAQASYDPNNMMSGFVSGMAEGTVSACEQEVAAAQNQLNMALATRASTPPRISVPNLVEYPYPVLRVNLRDTLTATVKVLDLASGEAIVARQFHVLTEVEDRSNEADAIHNVPPDLLQLPGEGELRERTVIDACRQVGENLEKALSVRGSRFVNLARQAAAAQDKATAAEYAMLFLLASPVRTADVELAAAEVLGYLDPEAGELSGCGLEEALRLRARVLLSPGRLPLEVSEEDGQVQVNGADSDAVAVPLRYPCLLLAVEGYPVTSLPGLRSNLERYGAGDTVSLNVESDGRPLNLRVTLK